MKRRRREEVVLDHLDDEVEPEIFILDQSQKHIQNTVLKINFFEHLKSAPTCHKLNHFIVQELPNKWQENVRAELRRSLCKLTQPFSCSVYIAKTPQRAQLPHWVKEVVGVR